MTSQDLARFRAGDSDVFRDLVEHHSPRLLALCNGFAPDSDAAHDLVQETWVRVFAKRRSFHGGSFPAWLFVVCRRVCLSASRQRTSHMQRSGVGPDTLPDLADRASPERGAARAELRASISLALLGLPTRQREAVVCRLIDGLSTRETALQMGCAEGTVKATLHQALGALARPLRAHSDTVEPTDPRPQPQSHRPLSAGVDR